MNFTHLNTIHPYQRQYYTEQNKTEDTSLFLPDYGIYRRGKAAQMGRKQDITPEKKNDILRLLNEFSSKNKKSNITTIAKRVAKLLNVSKATVFRVRTEHQQGNKLVIQKHTHTHKHKKLLFWSNDWLAGLPDCGR